MFLFVLIDPFGYTVVNSRKIESLKSSGPFRARNSLWRIPQRAGAVYQGLGNSEAFCLFRHFSRGQIEFGPARGSREQEQQLRRSDFRVAKALATMDDMAQPARSFQSMPNARREDNTG